MRPAADRQSVLDVLADSDGALRGIERDLVLEVKSLAALSDPPLPLIGELNVLRANVRGLRAVLSKTRDAAEAWR